MPRLHRPVVILIGCLLAALAGLVLVLAFTQFAPG